MGSLDRKALFPRMGEGLTNERSRVLKQNKLMSTADMVNKLSGASSASISKDSRKRSLLLFSQKHSGSAVAQASKADRSAKLTKDRISGADFTEEADSQEQSRRRNSISIKIDSWEMRVRQLSPHQQSSQKHQEEVHRDMKTLDHNDSQRSFRINHSAGKREMRRTLSSDSEITSQVQSNKHGASRGQELEAHNPYKKLKGTENYLRILAASYQDASRPGKPGPSFFVVSKGTHHRSKKASMLEAQLHL